MTAAAIKVTIQGVLTNGNLSRSFAPGQISIDQDRALSYSPVVSVGTSEEDMLLGDIAANGWIFLQNLDPTNYVKWGPKIAGAMVEFGRIKPGETQAFRLEPGATLRWKADTAACKVAVEHWNN